MTYTGLTEAATQQIEVSLDRASKDMLDIGLISVAIVNGGAEPNAKGNALGVKLTAALVLAEWALKLKQYEGEVPEEFYKTLLIVTETYERAAANYAEFL